MLKITMVVLGVALTTAASAAGWRSLRLDASSDAAFEQSLAVFKDKLSPGRRFVFGEALQDIWQAGVSTADAEQREYTTADYYRDLDGLTYKEVVTFTDPTGETARTRYYQARTPGVALPAPPVTSQALGESPTYWDRTENPRGRTPLFGVPGQL